MRLKKLIKITRHLPVKILRLAPSYDCCDEIVLRKYSNTNFDADKLPRYLNYKVYDAHIDSDGWLVVSIEEPENGD